MLYNTTPSDRNIYDMENQVKEKGQEQKKCENPKKKGKQQIQKALETANEGSELKMYFIKTQTVFPDS